MKRIVVVLVAVAVLAFGAVTVFAIPGERDYREAEVSSASSQGSFAEDCIAEELAIAAAIETGEFM